MIRYPVKSYNQNKNQKLNKYFKEKMNFKLLKTKCKREYDYIITLMVTNEISLLLTWTLTKTNVTPNKVSVFSILCGFLCFLFYSFGWFFSGSLFLFLSHILDCTDGNLARAKEMFSPLGRWLDSISDRLTEIFVFMGASVYYSNQSDSMQLIILPLIDCILLLYYYYIVDISLSLGIAQKKQGITSIKIKDVYLKWGLFEPVIYGFILLTPFGLLNVQIIAIFFITILGLIYQAYKNYSRLTK